MSDSRPSRSELVSRAMSASAGFAALCALAVSMYQTKIMREQQKLSAWPYVTQQNTGGDSSYAWRVMNAGVGPALVRRMTIVIDGRPVRTWVEFLRTMTGTDPAELAARFRGTRATTSSIRHGTVLLPGSTTELVRVEGPFGGELRRLLNDPRVSIRVCYCSLYDECWLSDSKTVEPTPTGECPGAEDFRS